MEHSLPNGTWQSWFDAYGRKLLLFVRQWATSAAGAEDIVQEAFVRFWRSPHRATDDAHVQLFAMVRRAGLDLVRKTQRRGIREFASWQDADHAGWFGPTGLENQEREREMQEALTRLPAEQREVVVLKIWGERTFAQIACAIDVSPHTAASRYRYALDALRRDLTPPHHHESLRFRIENELRRMPPAAPPARLTTAITHALSVAGASNLLTDANDEGIVVLDDGRPVRRVRLRFFGHRAPARRSRARRHRRQPAARGSSFRAGDFLLSNFDFLMQTNLRFLILLAVAVGVTAVRAADSDMRRMEKRIVISDVAPVVAGQDALEPVTFLGVAVTPAEPALTVQLRLPAGQGLVVALVEPHSPAGKAGLKIHDVLTKLDVQILIDPRQLSVLVRNHRDGDSITFTYLRAGAEARVTAALARHVPVVEHVFNWTGKGGADMCFRTEVFGSPVLGGARVPGAPQQGTFNVPAPGVMSMPAVDRVMIFRPQAGLVFSDEAGSLVVHVNENGRELTAKDLRGEVVFAGPINTAEERMALPEELRRRLEKLEGLDVVRGSIVATGCGRICPG